LPPLFPSRVATKRVEGQFDPSTNSSRHRFIVAERGGKVFENHEPGAYPAGARTAPAAQPRIARFAGASIQRYEAAPTRNTAAWYIQNTPVVAKSSFATPAAKITNPGCTGKCQS
jgi:hypothetical protein